MQRWYLFIKQLNNKYFQLASILSTLREIKNKIKSNLVFILILSLLVAAIIAWVTSLNKGVYGTYSNIFPLSINKGGSASPVDALRAQFGLSDKTDFDKIYNVNELVKSKTISFAIVRAKPNNPKYKSMSAWLIDDYNKSIPFWKKKITWNAKDSNDIHYQGAAVLLSNTSIENDSKTGFTKIVTKAHETTLVQEMNEKILSEISNFYIRFTTEKPRTDLHKIKLMRDSLRDELYANERAVAGFIDANQMSVKTTTQLPQSKLLRMQKEIEALYSVTATSYQNAKFKLLSESPIFQVLDKAGPPYSFDKPSWKKFAAIGFVLSFIFFCLFFCRKIFTRLVIEELSKI